MGFNPDFIAATLNYNGRLLNSIFIIIILDDSQSSEGCSTFESVSVTMGSLCYIFLMDGFPTL